MTEGIWGETRTEEGEHFLGGRRMVGGERRV